MSPQSTVEAFQNAKFKQLCGSCNNCLSPEVPLPNVGGTVSGPERNLHSDGGRLLWLGLLQFEARALKRPQR